MRALASAGLLATREESYRYKSVIRTEVKKKQVKKKPDQLADVQLADTGSSAASWKDTLIAG